MVICGKVKVEDAKPLSGKKVEPWRASERGKVPENATNGLKEASLANWGGEPEKSSRIAVATAEGLTNQWRRTAATKPGQMEGVLPGNGFEQSAQASFAARNAILGNVTSSPARSPLTHTIQQMKVSAWLTRRMSNISRIRLLAGQKIFNNSLCVFVGRRVAERSVANCILGCRLYSLRNSWPEDATVPPSTTSPLQAAHWLQDDRRQNDQSPIASGLVRTIPAAWHCVQDLGHIPWACCQLLNIYKCSLHN